MEKVKELSEAQDATGFWLLEARSFPFCLPKDMVMIFSTCCDTLNVPPFFKCILISLGLLCWILLYPQILRRYFSKLKASSGKSILSTVEVPDVGISLSSISVNR